MLKISAYLLVTSMILLAGCAQPYDAELKPVQPYVMRTVPIDDSIGFNAEVLITASRNVTISEWTSAGVASEPGENAYEHSKGEPMGVIIKNGTSEEITIEVSLTPERGRTPEGYALLYNNIIPMVKFSSYSVQIPPESVMNVPLIITIPKNAKLPDRWVFWVKIENVSQTGMIRTNGLQRWLVDMQ